MNITVVYSLPTRRVLAGPYADTDQDTVDSAMEVAAALKEKGATVVLMPVDEDSIDRILTIQADCIVNLIDWTGLDLPLSDRAFARIEELGIPFTGASRANFLLTSDKIAMKTAFIENNLPTAKFQVFMDSGQNPRDDFHYPVIIKPALEHCSIGLTKDAVVFDERALIARISDRLKAFNESMIIEEFIDGREFQITCITLPSGLLVLPPAEILFTTHGAESLLTYDSRWNSDTAEYASSRVALATIDEPLSAALQDVARKTFYSMGYRDYARLDVRTRGNDIFLLEANSNPGLSDDIEYGMTVSYRAIGWSFSDFIWKIVASAQRRFSASQS